MHELCFGAHSGSAPIAEIFHCELSREACVVRV